MQNVKFASYKLEKIIASTATSIVYLANNLSNSSQVVLKFIKRIKGKEHRIANEVEITQNCNHQNIIKVLDQFEYKQFHVLVIENAPFNCMFSIIHNHFPNGLPEKTVKIMFYQLLLEKH